MPKTAVYDDGCHLIKYLHNHIEKDLIATNAAKELAQVKFSVDRTHFRNHVGSWCRANMNPEDNPCISLELFFRCIYCTFSSSKRKYRSRRSVV